MEQATAKNTVGWRGCGKLCPSDGLRARRSDRRIAQVNTRNRTIFYATLGRLLFMEDTPGKFNAFLAPFTVVCNNLAAAAGDVNAFRSQQARPRPCNPPSSRSPKL